MSSSSERRKCLQRIPGLKRIHRSIWLPYTRQAVHTPANVRKTKKAVKMAFENQLNNKPGLSFIEIVSNCNSGWKMTPVQANQWMVDNMFPYYPLGDIKVDGGIVSL